MSFAPEEQLLLLASRSEPAPDDCSRMQQLAARPLQWDRLVETAVRQGVAPMVHRGLVVGLGRSHSELVPEPPRSRLEELAATSSARNRRLLGVVGEILHALDGRGIRPLGLKDLGLAVEVFPDPGLRPLGDLDLLVAHDEYEEVAAAMAGIGFESLMTPGATFMLAYGWGHHFRRAEGNVWVDLQWNVLQREWGAPAVGRRSFDPAVLRDGAYGVQLPGDAECELLVPSREAMLFHLCSHLEGHEYGELILFCDIAECLRCWEDELDWERVISIARRFEAEATVFHVLRLTRSLLGAPVPEHVLAELSRDTFRAGVFPAIFGGLGWMHFSLDDIEANVAPPAGLMARLDARVRGQVVRGQSLYDELDGVVADFREANGELLVLQGHGESRRFPDPQLEPFGTVDLVVLDRDLGRLREVAGARGYLKDAGGDLTRTLVTGAGPLEVRIEIAAPGALFDDQPAALTNREIVKRSLGARLARRGAGADAACLRAVGVGAADMLVWLLARLGDRGHDVLFGLPPILDVLRGLRGLPDPGAVVERARARGVATAVARGAALVDEIVPGDPLIGALQEQLGVHEAPAALEWAREGPGAEEAQGELRSAYLLTLCLLEARGEERGLLLRGLVRRRNGDGTPLGSIARGVVRTIPGLLRPTPRPPAVYWLER
jgi:hypothetical protein